MSTYFIGDVHGCYDELMALLERLRFNRDKDRLIFVGDLVNRGGQSVAVLRYIHSLGDRAQVVLGNHDISLIAYAYGVFHGRGTDFADIMKASDSRSLVEWLRQQPLLIERKKDNVVVTHAGIPPRWSLAQAIQQAQKAEKKLRGDNVEKYLRYAYQKGGEQWRGDFSQYDKFRYRINGFSRLRYCDKKGEPNYQEKCPIGKQKKGFSPWFEQRQRSQNDGQTRVVFGHWAALGYYESANAVCLDSGCAWGGRLTAVSFTKQAIKRKQIKGLKKKR